MNVLVRPNGLYAVVNTVTYHFFLVDFSWGALHRVVLSYPWRAGTNAAVPEWEEV